MRARRTIHDQVIENACGPALSQRQIVFPGASFVGMAFEANALARIGGQVSGVKCQHFTVGLAEFGDVKFEVKNCGAESGSLHPLGRGGGSGPGLGFQFLCAAGGCVNTRLNFCDALRRTRIYFFTGRTAGYHAAEAK